MGFDPVVVAIGGQRLEVEAAGVPEQVFAGGRVGVPAGPADEVAGRPEIDVDGGGVETVAAVVAREVRGTAEACGPAPDVPQVRDVVVDVLVGLA